MTSIENLSHYTLIATQAALEAGEILRKGFGTSYQISSKPGRQNIVTQYDHLSEEHIIALIKAHFPHDTILAEESGLTKQNEDAVCWMVDPLDGTTNFSRHLPFFTISIAVYKGEIGLCGVIYQPMTNELFISQKGQGAYLNGKKLSVSATSDLNEALIGGGFPYNITENPIPYLEHFTQFTKMGVTVRHLGSAALALAYVAAGKFDGFWMDQLHPWDLAAGKLLVEEAGGKVTLYSGNTHQIQSSSNILATNQIIHHQILSYLKNN